MIITELLKDFLNVSSAIDQKFILAVSGGKDSMALAHLCKSENLNIVIAHCNFMLRGQESIDDEEFVRSYCSTNQITFESIRFNTKTTCEELGLSTQETARILRYNWFEKIRQQHHANYILTAHHANDLAETFIFNAARGSGINGLGGIPKKNGVVLRPLIMVGQNTINNYITAHQVPFRNDSSNFSDDYTRNFIRHHIIPKLIDVNNHAIEHIAKSTQILQEAQIILIEKLNEIIDKHSSYYGSTLIIDNSIIKQLPYYNYLLNYWLSPFGFNSNQINEITSTDHCSGKTWNSNTHVLLFNRDELRIEKLTNDNVNTLLFEKNFPDKFIFNGYHFEVTYIDKKHLDFKENLLYFDAEKIKFPITIRIWNHGDSFKPLGMFNNKKVSDFFIDQKIDILEKTRIPIICDKHQVIAVVPYRIDNRYKITDSTNTILRLKVTQ
jgi:tRNA(Ile)-lysidine synthase